MYPIFKGTHCTVLTILNFDQKFPSESVRELQYACTDCRVKRWYYLLSRHRAHDCSYLQHKQLGDIYNVISWTGVMVPPTSNEIEAISNTGLFMRAQLDKDPNTWMYWVRNQHSAFYYGAKSVTHRTKEAEQFQNQLACKSVTPINRTSAKLNPMLMEPRSTL